MSENRSAVVAMVGMPLLIVGGILLLVTVLGPADLRRVEGLQRSVAVGGDAEVELDAGVGYRVLADCAFVAADQDVCICRGFAALEMEPPPAEEFVVEETRVRPWGDRCRRHVLTWVPAESGAHRISSAGEPGDAVGMPERVLLRPLGESRVGQYVAGIVACWFLAPFAFWWVTRRRT